MAKEEDVLSSYSKDELEELLIKHFVTLNRYGDKGLHVEKVKLNSETYKFLQRMEKKRLDVECNQALDMRGKQPDKTVEVEHKHLTHHLDKKSQKIFEVKLAEYNGRFTQGVYEAVINADHTYKALQQKEDDQRRQQMEAQRTGEPVAINEQSIVEQRQRYLIDKSELLAFGSLVSRQEARLMYITEVEVTEPGRPSVIGRTRDLSVNGLYITIDADEFFCRKGDALTVQLHKLEQDLKAGELIAIFKVLKVEQKQDKLHIHLQRKNDGTSKNYIKTIAEFVDKNVRRYKADYQDVIEHASARLYEHNYCKNFIDLPLIVSKHDDGYFIEAALVNEINRDLLHDLTHGATSTSMNLHTLVNHMLPRVMTTDSDDFAQSTVGSFLYTPKGEEPKLYVACDRQYVDKVEQKKFLAVGKCCNRFQLHKVLCAQITAPDKQKAQKLLETQADYKPVEMEEAADFLENSRFLVVIQDITASLRQKLIPSVQLTEKQLTAACRAFKNYVVKPKPNLTPKRFQIGFRPTRKEERYLYEIDVEISNDFGHFTGSTMDFSINGLGIKVDGKCNFATGAVVNVALPDFVKRTKDKTLAELEYRVVGVSDDKTEVYLIKVSPKTGDHRGSEFFKMIIDKNRDKLEPCPKENLAYFQTHISQIFLVDHLLSAPFFIGRREKSYSLNSIAYNSRYSSLLKAFEVDAQHYEFPFLLKPQLLDYVIEACKRAEKAGKKYFQTVLFSYINSEGCVEVRFIDKDFKEPKQLSAFIAQHKDNKTFHSFLFKLQSSFEVATADFEEELSNVRVHSINRYRQLVEELKSLRFVGEIISIDEQVL